MILYCWTLYAFIVQISKIFECKIMINFLSIKKYLIETTYVLVEKSEKWFSIMHTYPNAWDLLLFNILVIYQSR